MAWRKQVLTNATNSLKLSFAGRGSVYCDGTFGGAVIQIKPIAATPATGADDIATGVLYSIDGSTVVSADLPHGRYQILLSGGAASSINVWDNIQETVAIAK